MQMDIKDYYAGIKAEERRDKQLLHLTANESFMSATAKAFMSSRLADRYYMGGGDKEGVVDYKPFTFLGMPRLQDLVTAAETAAQKMLNAVQVNLNCLSGIHAMMCTILSATDPGDAVMSVSLEHGGHFATAGILERTGRRHIPTTYDYDALRFDANKIAKDYHQAGAKAFYMDVSFYLNPHNLKELRQALGEEAIIIYDASHTLGLIMGQQFQAPLKEGANIVCGNTHKTLPGPQKGLIAFRDQALAAKASTILDSGLYSSRHTGSMVALATTILEMEQFGSNYAKQIIANSNALGGALASAGLPLRRANTGRYSENHQVHLMSEDLGNYRQLYRQLISNNLSVNFDAALGAGTYIRLGTQEITRRGMKEAEMTQVADFLRRSLAGEAFPQEVARFMKRFQTAHYSFDS